MFFTPLQAEKFIPKAYNSFAGAFSSTRHYQWKEFDQLSSTLPTSGKIVDLGCGNGRLFQFVKDAGFTGEYVGVDISKGLLTEAKKHNPDACFAEGSFLSLPESIAASSIDQVWAVASFHHLSQVSDREKALQNIHDILSENGEFICTVWNLWDQKKYEPQKKEAITRARINPFWNMRDFIIPWGNEKTPRYYYSFDISELEYLMQKMGFTIEDSFLSEGGKNICIRAKKVPQRKVYIADIPFHTTSLKKSLQQISKWENEEKTEVNIIFTPNPEMLVESKKNDGFKKSLQKSSLSLADGNGILWASGISYLQHKTPFWKWTLGITSLISYAIQKSSFPSFIPQPICGSDLFVQYLENSADRKHIFLLGGSEGSAAYISEKYSGRISGYFDGKVSQSTQNDIITAINDSQATVLFVALGAPKQELWIEENKDALLNIKVAAGVGGSFDFVSGHQKRAPKILRSLGLEWVYRLVLQPERAGRIWNATGRFISLILSSKKTES